MACRLEAIGTLNRTASHSPATSYKNPAYFILADNFYIIGGSPNPSDDDATSYEVTTVNLKTGKVGEAADILHATNLAAAAPSLTRIALCGGKTPTAILNHCQMYSSVRDE